jgi:hypothetical protein
MISDSGCIFAFFCAPERLALLDLRDNQIYGTHPKFPTLVQPQLRVLLEGNPGFLLPADTPPPQSELVSDSSALSCFVPPAILTPPSEATKAAPAEKAGLELLRELYEAASDEEEDETSDSDYVSSEEDVSSEDTDSVGESTE